MPEEKEVKETKDPLRMNINDLIMPPPTPKDWPEDYKFENGCYERSCVYCKSKFYGYKRRLVCKECFKKYECNRRSTVND